MVLSKSKGWRTLSKTSARYTARIRLSHQPNLHAHSHQRPAVEPGKTWCQVLPLVKLLVNDLSSRPSYVLNLRRIFADWSAQAPHILSSFRRDHARAENDPAIDSLVAELKKVAPEFRQWWQQHDVHAPCTGRRSLGIEGLGEVGFEHTSLIVDEVRHLRLVVYAVQETDPRAEAFAGWVSGEKRGS